MTLSLCSGVCLCLYLCFPCNVVGYGHPLCWNLSRVVHGLPVPGERRWQGHAKWLPWVAADVREESWSQQDRWCGEALPMDGPPLLLLPDCNPLSLSSQTPLATLGSCLLPVVLICFSLLGKCPLREWLTADYDNSKHFYSNNCYLFVQRHKAGKEVKCLKGCSFKSSLKYVVFLMKCGRIWQPQTDPIISRSHRLGCESSSLAT